MSGTESEFVQGQTENKKHKKYTVLGQRLGGGPHGIGDPDDQTLRKVETDVLILEKVRYIAKTEKCQDLSKAFNECGKEAGLLLPFKCRAENSKLQECLQFWYENLELRAQCKEEYLKERSQYRRTGIPPKRFNRKTKTMEPTNSAAE